MAISENIITPSFALTRNPFQVQLSTPDAITTAGVAESITALMNFNPQNDDVLQISWSFDGESYSAIFTFKTSPDADLFEIEAGTTDLAYINNHIIPGLLSHPDLAEFFEIESWESAPNEGFILRARAPYIGPMGLDVQIQSNPIPETGSTTGIAEVRPDDFLASIWIYMGDAHDTPEGQMKRIGEFELFPDAANLCNINLSPILDAYFTVPETPTENALTAPELCLELTRPFFYLYGQKYGDPQTRRKQFKSAAKYAMKGGLRVNDVPTLGEFSTWIDGNLLTIRTEREIFADQMDWIFWHHRDKNVSGWDVGIRTTINFTDGSQQSSNLFVDTSQNLTFGKIYQFRADLVGSGVKAIADGAGKTAHDYYISMIIKDPGSVSIQSISNSVRFIVRDPDALGLVLEYENTLGAIESWAMVGNRQLSGKITAEKFRSGHYPAPMNSIPDELISYNEQDQPIITLNTGAMNKTDAAAFPDFMRSRHKWIRSGSNRIPVQIIDSKYQVDQVNSESDFMRNQKFSLALAPSKSVSNLTEFWQ